MEASLKGVLQNRKIRIQSAPMKIENYWDIPSKLLKDNVMTTRLVCSGETRVVWLFTLLLLVLFGSCSCYVVDTRAQPPLSPGCLDSGLNILKQKDVKRIKATFDLKAKLVYYRVIFCQRSWICFATSIDGDVDRVENNIVRHEELWTKLVWTILGYSKLEQYSRTKHGLMYGNENDHFYCHGNYYIITGKPTRLALRNVSKARVSARTSCLNSKSCSRTCLRAENESYKCQEIRLHCSFDKCSSKQQQQQKQQKQQRQQRRQQQKRLLQQKQQQQQQQQQSQLDTDSLTNNVKRTNS